MLKRAISVILCTVMTAAMFATVCSAGVSEVTISDSTVTSESNTYDLTIPAAGTLITAVYNAANELIEVVADVVSQGTMQKEVASGGEAVGGTVKFMLLDTVKGMKPVSKSAQADVKEFVVVKVMPLGDSITDGFNVPGGYRNTLEPKIVTAGIDAHVDFVGSMTKGGSYDGNHEGHSGWAIEAIPQSGDIEKKGRKGLATEINSWMNSYKPDVVMLMIGTNDILSQYDLDNAKTRLSNLVDKVIAGAAEDATVYIATIPYLKAGGAYDKTGKTQAELDAQVDAYNEGVRAVAEEKGLTLVDVNSALTLSDLSDGTHPTAAGYEKLGELWYDSIIDELNSRIN